MTSDTKYTEEEQTVIDQVRAIKGFYSHLMTYVMVISLLFTINLLRFNNIRLSSNHHY